MRCTAEQPAPMRHRGRWSHPDTKLISQELVGTECTKTFECPHCGHRLLVDCSAPRSPPPDVADRARQPEPWPPWRQQRPKGQRKRHKR